MLKMEEQISIENETHIKTTAAYVKSLKRQLTNDFLCRLEVYVGNWSLLCFLSSPAT